MLGQNIGSAKIDLSPTFVQDPLDAIRLFPLVWFPIDETSSPSAKLPFFYDFCLPI